MPDRKRRRILFVTAWYPHRERPVEGVFVQEHARAVARCHDVAVLHCMDPQEAEPLLGRLERAGTDEGELPLYRLHRRRPRLPGFGLPASSLALWRGMRAIERAGFRPEVLHAHVFSAAAPAAVVGGVRRLPLVVSEHFSAIPRGTLTPAERRNARFAFRHAAAILPVSEVLRRGIEALGVRGPFRIVPNVADPALFHPPNPRRRSAQEDPARLLTVGTMAAPHVKGIPTLLDAVAQLPRLARDWRLDLVGDGPARREYEQRAERLGLSSRVHFHGLLSKGGVAAQMREADVFVLASRFENLPCVVIEALATGLPVVATGVGGMPELISSQDGLLVPPDDPEALAAALASVVSGGERFDREAIARRASRFAPERIAEAIDAVYQDVLSS